MKFDPDSYQKNYRNEEHNIIEKEIIRVLLEIGCNTKRVPRKIREEEKLSLKPFLFYGGVIPLKTDYS